MKPAQEGGGEFLDPGIGDDFPIDGFPEELPPEELPPEETQEPVEALKLLDGESVPYMGEEPWKIPTTSFAVREA